MKITSLKTFSIVILLAGAWASTSASDEVVFQGKYWHHLFIKNLFSFFTTKNRWGEGVRRGSTSCGTSIGAVYL